MFTLSKLFQRLHSIGAIHESLFFTIVVWSLLLTAGIASASLFFLLSNICLGPVDSRERSLGFAQDGNLHVLGLIAQWRERITILRV